MPLRDYSGSPVMLLAPTASDYSEGAGTVRTATQAMPGLRLFSDPAAVVGKNQTLLILVPAEWPGVPDIVGQIFRSWIDNRSATVFRTSDGTAHSRFMIISEESTGTIKPDLGFFLDGSVNRSICIGTEHSPERDAFIAHVNRILDAGVLAAPAKPDIKAVEVYMRGRFNRDFPPLAYHNPVHIQDVYESSLRIGEAEGVSSAEINLLRVGALFHDAGFLHTTAKHEECGADMAAGILPVFGFSQDDIAVIRSMIMATRIPQDPKNLLDRIMCDADLDYLGREDFYLIGKRLYVELKQVGVVQDDRSWNTLQQKFLTAHRYHTVYSQTNREPKKQVRLKEIAEMLSGA